MVEQGDIIKISDVKYPLLVVSKSSYNLSNHILACPILPSDNGSVLSFPINTESAAGFVRCDSLHMFDLNVRRFSPNGRVPLSCLIQIVDIIQSLFDYV